MSRDPTGFRSWFQRAMLLSPTLNTSSFQKPDEDEDDEDDDNNVGNELSVTGTEWPSSKDSLHSSATIIPESCNKGMCSTTDVASRSRRSDFYSEWCLLQEDNVRLWDCLSMLRTDPTITSHTAIHIVTQAPNSDYFPKDIRSGFKNFFKDENQLVVEVLRLSVENQKLHAVLWVLADNSAIRVDSVLAAIFRLNDIQFREKFKFEYRPGCFSDKGMVMGPPGRDEKSSTAMSHGKRCRSSTPIRSSKPIRNNSDRVSQSVSRKGNSRIGGQNNSSNRRCRMQKLEPPRKHPDVWMMSALLAELDNPSSNNALLKMLKQQMEAYKRDSDLEGNEDEDDNKSDHFNDEILQNDCIQLSHRPAKEQITCPIRNKPRSLSRGNTQLRFTVHDITGNEPNNFSNNCSSSIGVQGDINKSNHKPKHLSLTTIPAYFDASKQDILCLYDNFVNNCSSIDETKDENQSNVEQDHSLFAIAFSNFDMTQSLHTISHHIYEDLLSSKEKQSQKEQIKPKYQTSVFENTHQRWRKSLTGTINHQPVMPITPRISLIPLSLSIPYEINNDMIPIEFIQRQAYIEEIMGNRVRKTNLLFCPVGKRGEGRNLLRYLYNDIPLPSRCCQIRKWQTENPRCVYLNEPIVCSNDKPQASKDLLEVVGKHKSESIGDVTDKTKKKEKMLSVTVNEPVKSNSVEKHTSFKSARVSSMPSIIKSTSTKAIQCPMYQGVLRDCNNNPENTRNLMKKALPLLGKKQFVNSLSKFINNNCRD